jgi:predicted transcriptional regulator
MKFKIVGQGSNASYDWKKRKKPPMPEVEKSIPDSDLCLQKGKSYRQALKAHKTYRYEGKPYGVEHPHV